MALTLIEDKLAALRVARKAKDAAEAEAKRLSDEITETMNQRGDDFLFLADDGHKIKAFVAIPENTVVDVELLADFMGDDVEQVLKPRAVDLDKFKRLVADERIPKSVLVKVARLVDGKPQIRFTDLGE